MLDRTIPEQERRKYIRLDSVFPVQLRLIDNTSAHPSSDWLQGFTSNISRGGICLSVNNLPQESAALIRAKTVSFALRIEMPFSAREIPVTAGVAWIKDVDPAEGRYLVGLRYVDISAADNARIMRYARAKQLFVPTVLGIIICLGLAFSVGSYLNVKLIRGSKALVDQLIAIVQESSVAKQRVKEISKEREDLRIKIRALEVRIKMVDEERRRIGEKEAKAVKKVEELNRLIDAMTREKTLAQEALISVQHEENAVTEDLLHLDKRRATFEQARLDAMYRWLSGIQDSRSGLAESAPDVAQFSHWGFLYDQAALLQTYVYFSDITRARMVLDFFEKKAQRRRGFYYNAYRVDDGSPATDAVSCGPNIRLGIAIMQYVHKSGDTHYLGLVEETGAALLQLQTPDAGGALEAGAGMGAVSQEDTIDAYAFFSMLGALTSKPGYAQAADAILVWMRSHAPDGEAEAEFPDTAEAASAIATGTFVEAIAAVGPARLEGAGMNPERFIEACERRFGVEVEFVRSDGTSVKVQGFDAAPRLHSGRGGMVSPELTAQMALAYSMLADFYHGQGMIAKSRSYLVKADGCLAALEGVTLPPAGQQENFLPHATQENAHTGHGWIAPHGQSQGSISATAYTLFAYYRFNPLQFKE